MSHLRLEAYLPGMVDSALRHASGRVRTLRADFYNEAYKRENYFRHPTWACAPFVSSLISFCGLKKGDSVLDVGCGQGFFSYLFSTHGMKVHGVDVSETGVRGAENLYARLGITFSVADIQTLTFPKQFDCVFVRSCTLYNTDAFPTQKEVTHNVLRHLKSSGSFIFAYNSNFSSKTRPSWRYHSLEDVRQHFSSYHGAQIFFLNKMMPFLLGKYCFNQFLTDVNVFLSKVSGMGGDVICILRGSSAAHEK